MAARKARSSCAAIVCMAVQNGRSIPRPAKAKDATVDGPASLRPAPARRTRFPTDGPTSIGPMRSGGPRRFGRTLGHRTRLVVRRLPSWPSGAEGSRGGRLIVPGGLYTVRSWGVARHVACVRKVTKPHARRDVHAPAGTGEGRGKLRLL